VVSLPCPGYTQVSSGSRSKTFASTSPSSDSKSALLPCVLPTPPGNSVDHVNSGCLPAAEPVTRVVVYFLEAPGAVTA
jgi:hypothetical protein